MQLGTRLEEDFNRWGCTEKHECEGVCVASAQLSRDLISSTAVSKQDHVRRSDIITVELMNPQTEEFIPLNMRGVNGGPTIAVPIIGVLDSTSHSIQVDEAYTWSHQCYMCIIENIRLNVKVTKICTEIYVNIYTFVSFSMFCVSVILKFDVLYISVQAVC